MKHTPVLIVENEKDGPGLRILTRCLDCDVTLTDHAIDASKVGLVRAGRFGDALGTDAAEVWFQHSGWKKAGGL